MTASNVRGTKIVPYSNGPQVRDFMKGQIFGTIPPLTASEIASPDDRSRTIIITGANSGLGLEAAKQLVRLGVVSRLILACRSMDRGRKARDFVLAAEGESQSNVAVDVWVLDMSSRSSIRAFAERAGQELNRIDAIILNAGVDLMRYEKVSEEDGGYELSIMVNVVGTVVLAVLMVPILRAKALPQSPPRVTIVGSSVQFAVDYQLVVDAATNERGEGVLGWLSDESRWRDKITKDRYFLTKGLLQMAVRQLARRVADGEKGRQTRKTIINCVNPGWCRTDLFRESGTFGSRMGLRLIGWDAEVGARALIIGAIGINGDQSSHGGYMSEGKVKTCCTWFETEQGEEIARRLWEEVSRDIEATKPGTLATL